MQLCSWMQSVLLECGQAPWLALGIGLVHISSEIGPCPAANGSAVALRSHLLRLKKREKHVSLSADKGMLDF